MRTILIQEDDYERQYRESMDYLNNKYHNQPTMLKNIPMDDVWYPGMQQAQHTRRVTMPNGKRVV